jgi:hypothetical protein
MYEDGSTWIGNGTMSFDHILTRQVDNVATENGEAVYLSKGSKPVADTWQESTSTPFGRAFYENKANYPVYPYSSIVMTNITVAALSAVYWAVNPIVAVQLLRQLQIHFRQLNIFALRWYSFSILYSCIATCFIINLNILSLGSMLLLISSKWVIIGQRHEGRHDWDKSSYNQRWQVHRTLHSFLLGYGGHSILAPLTGSVYIVWYLRAMGAKIGRNCFIYAGDRSGFMTEPDLVEVRFCLNLWVS